MWLLLSIFAVSCAFRTVWVTTSPDELITLPLNSTVSLTITWGDGSAVESIQTSPVQHRYAVAGEYVIGIDGTVSSWGFGGAGDCAKIVRVESWVGFQVDTNSPSDFSGCSALTVNASDQPVFLPGASLANFFKGCSSLNTSLSWDLTGVTSLRGFLQDAVSFDQPLSFVGTESVTDMSFMFEGAVLFDHPISFETTQNVVNMSWMFSETNFNQLLNFDTKNVADMSGMFAMSNFNQPLHFNTQSVTTMASMFFFSDFNQFPNFTDTSKVTTMEWMFANTDFDQNINHFDTSNVTDMSYMFAGSSFNQPLTLNTGKVIEMQYMFSESLFISSINFIGGTSLVTNVKGMFNSYFTQNLAAWAMPAVTSCEGFCQACGLPNFEMCRPCENPQPTSLGWVACECPADQVCDSSAFISQWVTSASNETIFLPLSGVVSISVDWGDGSSLKAYLATPVSHSYSVPGNYSVRVVGPINGWSFSGGGSCKKIKNVVSWGNFQIGPTSAGGFEGCTSLIVDAPDQPVFLPGASLENFFKGCSLFNTDLRWDLTNVISLKGFLQDAVSFNQPLFFLDTTANVTDMSSMLNGAIAFNQIIVMATTNVVKMNKMFYNALAFNQSLSNNYFNTEKVTSMSNMFSGANLFLQNLSSWSVAHVTSCDSFCPDCNLPNFEQCAPCQTIMVKSPGWHTCNCPTGQKCDAVCSGAYAGLPGNCTCGDGYFGTVTYENNIPRGCVGVPCLGAYAGLSGNCVCAAGYGGTVTYSGNMTKGCALFACPTCDVTITLTNITQTISVGTTKVVIPPALLTTFPNATLRMTTFPLSVGPRQLRPAGGDVFVSIVMSQNGKILNDTQLTQPIQFTIPFNREASKASQLCSTFVAECVERKGMEWVDSGCKASVSSRGIQCTCMHLGDFMTVVDSNMECHVVIEYYYLFCALYGILIMYCMGAILLLLTRVPLNEITTHPMMKTYVVIALVGVLRLLFCLDFLGVFGKIGPVMNVVTTTLPVPLEYLLFTFLASSWIWLTRFNSAPQSESWGKFRPIFIVSNVIGALCAIGLLIMLVLDYNVGIVARVGTDILAFLYLIFVVLLLGYSRELAAQLAVLVAQPQQSNCSCLTVEKNIRWLAGVISCSFIIQAISNVVALEMPKSQLSYWTALGIVCNLIALVCLIVVYHVPFSRTLKEVGRPDHKDRSAVQNSARSSFSGSSGSTPMTRSPSVSMSELFPKSEFSMAVPISPNRQASSSVSDGIMMVPLSRQASPSLSELHRSTDSPMHIPFAGRQTSSSVSEQPPSPILPMPLSPRRAKSNLLRVPSPFS